MKKWLKLGHINRTVFLLCALLIASATVHAELLVYEPFDVDSAAGSGTVWWGIDTGSTNLGQWVAPNDLSNSYLVDQGAYIDGTGAALPTTGLSARVDSNDNTTEPNADLESPVSFNNGDTAYMSFLVKHNSDDRQWNRIGFQFDGGNVWVEFPANTQNNGTRGVFFNGATGPALTEIIPNDVWHFFVVRVDFSGAGPETLTLWWNPPLAGEPDPEDALITATNELGSTLNNISAISKAAVTSMEFDEIRVGTSYADATGVSSLMALNPENKEKGVLNDVGPSANGPGLVLNWTAPADREFVVVDYLVSMGEDPNFPVQADKFSLVSVPVAQAPVQGVTTPADQTDPNGSLDISSAGSYPVEIVPDMTYYWQVFANVYEPNFNAGQPDPNIPIYNAPSQIGGSYWSFVGKVTEVTILADPDPASDYILPDPQSHMHDAVETADFTVTFEAGVDVDTVEWFLDDVSVCVWDKDTGVSGDPGYNIVVDEGGTPQTTTLEISISGMDADPSVGAAFKGDYTCTITLTNSSTDTTEAPGSLYVSDKLLAHRYQFSETTGATEVVDSVGGVNGTIVDPNGVITFSAGQIVFGDDPAVGSSGDADAAYVDLGSGFASKFGKAATFMAWFTRSADNSNWQYILNCNDGGTGAESSRVFLGATDQIRFGADLDGSGNDYTINSGTQAPEAQEVCAVGVSDDLTNTETLYIFVDGELVDTDTNSANDLSEIDDINCWIAKSHDPAQPVYTGSINELRVYDFAISGVWVEALVANGPDGDPLVANPCLTQPEFDWDGNCVVDLADLDAFIQSWLDCGYLSCQ